MTMILGARTAPASACSFHLHGGSVGEASRGHPADRTKLQQSEYPDGTHTFFAGTYTVDDGVIVAADIH